MVTLPQCKFAIGQRVTTTDRQESGIILAILYAEAPTGAWWSRPGFTYHIKFDTPRAFLDDAHETQLEATL
jgi:hypothetical protein